MTASKKTFDAKISQVFSSLAASFAVGVLAVVSLVVVTAEDIRAEGGRVAVQSGPAVPAAAGWLGDFAQRPVANARPRGNGAAATPAVASPSWISRRPITPNYFAETSASREFLGISKLAFPLLVSDLMEGGPERPNGVTTGRAVGAR
jgi:hypothetical protein